MLSATLPQQADDGADALRSSLEQIVRHRWGTRTAITTMHRRPASNVGSYVCQVVSVRLATGDAFELFLKDFGISQLPKDGLSQRRERERCVYSELLADAELGTPEFYGSVWDESHGRFWLLLELVNGVRLDRHDVDSWAAAAGWLGRMQGYFAQHTDQLRADTFLLQHDAEFFWSKAELARRAVAQISPFRVGRLEEILSRYDRLVHVMVSQPRTLVHGSYRPENILVDRRSEALRVCPIDWELAGFGAPLYDLSFITDGADPPTFDQLCEAYRRAALAGHLTLPSREEMARVMTCFRLHKIIKSLSDSPGWPSPENKVSKLVDRAERLSHVVLGGIRDA